MSFGEPIMSTGPMPELATTRFEDASEKWWAGWRTRHNDARSYGKYSDSTIVGRIFKKHLMTVLLVIVAFFALIYYTLGMTVSYVIDAFVAPRLQQRKYVASQRRAVKDATRRMVQSDLE